MLELLGGMRLLTVMQIQIPKLHQHLPSRTAKAKPNFTTRRQCWPMFAVGRFLLDFIAASMHYHGTTFLEALFQTHDFLALGAQPPPTLEQPHSDQRQM